MGVARFLSSTVRRNKVDRKDSDRMGKRDSSSQLTIYTDIVADFSYYGLFLFIEFICIRYYISRKTFAVDIFLHVLRKVRLKLFMCFAHSFVLQWWRAVFGLVRAAAGGRVY